MPVITLQTSQVLTEVQQENLGALLAKHISLIPGKNPAGLLTFFETEKRSWHAGQVQSPALHLKVDVLANRSHAGYAQFVQAITEPLAATLGIHPGQVFVSFSDIDAWGVSSRVFEG